MQEVADKIEGMKDDVSATARSVKGTAKAAADEMSATVTSEFRKFIGDIEDLVKSMTSLSGDELGKAKQKIASRVSAAKSQVEEIGGSVTEKAKQAATATNEYVNEEPWKAIGIGAAVGFLLGVIVTRRS